MGRVNDYIEECGSILRGYERKGDVRKWSVDAGMLTISLRCTTERGDKEAEGCVKVSRLAVLCSFQPTSEMAHYDVIKLLHGTNTTLWVGAEP
jgi:hypothetical protein